MAFGKRIKQGIVLFLSAGCLIFLTVGCGLDVVSVVLDDFVTDVKDAPVVDSSGHSTSFDGAEFNFSTKKLDNSTDMGNGYVYYKIYNRYSTAVSQTNTLISITEDENRKGTSYTKMNEYGYKELHVKTAGSATPGPFQISNVYHNNIAIRLTNYSSGSFDAHIKVDGTTVGVPVRYSNAKTFDFGRTGDNDKKPEESDADFNYSSSPDPSEEGIYYVALFSVFMMFDENWDSVYSPIRYLGMVAINSANANN